MKEHHYRLVKSCFFAYCNRHGVIPSLTSTIWEDGRFKCYASFNGERREYQVTRASCSMCKGGPVDYCVFCGRDNQIKT